MHTTRALALAVLLLSACPSGATAAADCPAPTDDPAADEQQARRMFERALQLEPAEPEAALATLECADRLARKPAVVLRIGTIAERLGRNQQAADAFEQYLERAGESAPDVEQMRERIARLRAEPPAAEPEPEEPSDDGDDSSRVLAGWVLTAGGAALAITGVVLLGVAKAHSDEVHDIEPGTVAWDSDEARGTYEAAEIEQTLGIIGLAVGACVATIGLVLVTTADDEPAVTVRGSVGPDRAGGSVRVRF